MLFQGYFTDYWADPSFGKSQGIKAAQYATTASYPQGAMIFLNLEETSNAPAGSMPAWVKAWAAQVRAAGYQAGVYVGVRSGVTAADLNSLTGVSVYWQSVSTSGVPVPSRGYVITQTKLDTTADGCGIGVDVNTAGVDKNSAQLVGAAFPKTQTTATEPGTFVPLSPSRILDTRSNQGATGPVHHGQPILLQVTGKGGVPASGVASVVLNVTVTAPTGSGFITVYPTGKPRPNASSLNFATGQTVANLVTVPVGPNGQVWLYNGAANANVQLLADVAGYYLAGTATAAGSFKAVTPVRLLDTRPTGVGAGSSVNVSLAGQTGNDVVDAAVLNITSVLPKSTGYITAWEAGTGRPTASNINMVPGSTVPNQATVPTSAAEAVSLYNGSSSRTNMLADLAGYYLGGGTPTVTGAFQALTPTRILDTRRSLGGATRLGANTAISLLVAGKGGVPTTAKAVVMNVTVVTPSSAGYVSAFPSDQSAPTASNINFVAGQTVANQVIVPIGADGRVTLYQVGKGSADLLADVAGYILS